MKSYATLESSAISTVQLLVPEPHNLLSILTLQSAKGDPRRLREDSRHKHLALMQLILTTSIDLVDTDYQRNVWGDSFQGLVRSGDLPVDYLLVLANVDEEKNQVRVRYLSEGRVEGFDNNRMHVLDETNTVNENEAESISSILIVNPPGKS